MEEIINMVCNCSGCGGWSSSGFLCEKCQDNFVRESIKNKNVALQDRVNYLEDLLFKKGAMEQPPCFCCGYNGAKYYDPNTHPCAQRHHKLLTITED